MKTTGALRDALERNMAFKMHRADGTVWVKPVPPPMHVIPYDEVSRRLQARGKGECHG